VGGPPIPQIEDLSFFLNLEQHQKMRCFGLIAEKTKESIRASVAKFLLQETHLTSEKSSSERTYSSVTLKTKESICASVAKTFIKDTVL
jgi:hypothetical protein